MMSVNGCIRSKILVVCLNVSVYRKEVEIQFSYLYTDQCLRMFPPCLADGCTTEEPALCAVSPSRTL